VIIDFYAIAPRERLTSCGECAAIVAVPDQSKHRNWHEELAGLIRKSPAAQPLKIHFTGDQA
jgi:hypothetical protein